MLSTNHVAGFVLAAAAVAGAIAGLPAVPTVETIVLALTACAATLWLVGWRRGARAKASKAKPHASARGSIAAAPAEVGKGDGGAHLKKAAGSDATELEVIERIGTVCAEISKGNFEARLTHIGGTGLGADVQHAVNDIIDRCDAFVREATAAMAAVSRNIYYRHIMYGGLQGSFLTAARNINNSVDVQAQAVEKARRDTAAEQAKIIDSIALGLKNLVDGNLTIRITDLPEAYAKVRDDFNSATEGLQDTMRAIAAATGEVSNATAEIAASTTDLSQRTEEQAASLEETSASMDEMATTVRNNAASAQQASHSASSAREVADRGGAVIGEAIQAMGRIEASSRQIVDIIGVIDEIARQTNLLALNAAVEAARAGDAGRGFAVVASEVRSLAQRSSTAAKDVKNLIANSNAQVTEGVALVNKAGAALSEIVAAIATVTQVVSEIASASAEQSTGITEINKALGQMDEVAQQNSALVEQNAATAKTLEHQAAAMNERVAYFQLDDDDSEQRAVA